MASMNSNPPIFEKYGIEIEYMIVNRDTLKVMPVAHSLLTLEKGSVENEISEGDLAISNELALHVIEIKTEEPVSDFTGLAEKFSASISRLNSKLESLGAALMTGPAHPLMNPSREAHLWPYGNTEIYSAYDRIFGCRSHGWINLQSVHLNLSFNGDEEFARLHSAVRIILPLIPALAAASPILEGKFSGYRDTRLAVYAENQSMIPSITGSIIPEPVYTKREYERSILEPIYRDIGPYDPEKILCDEWLNSRGAIARFDRSALEIRLIDAQDSPERDLAVCAAVVCGIRAIDLGIFRNDNSMRMFSTSSLKEILMEMIRHGENAVIRDREYLSIFGIDAPECSGSDIWKKIISEGGDHCGLVLPFIETINSMLENGTIATEIRRALNPHPTEEEIINYYRRFLTKNTL